MKRISMWSGPRNVSTAIMYSFHHRGDCHVVDEPFYACYLETTGIEHPGRKETLALHESDSQKVIDSLVDKDYEKEILFMKNMPHHMLGIDLGFIQSFENFFLIREPRAMIASYIKKIPDVKMSDLGLDLQYRLFEELRLEGKEPAVIDSYELLRNPQEVLSKLCAKLDITFLDSMTKWDAGPIAQDGAWAKFWYANVHASKGLGAPKEPGTTELPAHLEELAQECEKYYLDLKKYEIRP